MSSRREDQTQLLAASLSLTVLLSGLDMKHGAISLSMGSCHYRHLICTHCNENPIKVFLFWELRGLSRNFHIHVSVSNYLFPGSVHIFDCSKIDRPILEKYINLSHIYMSAGIGRQNIIILFWK